ncbi:proline-rich membrane anchor 1 isoform X3 [Pipistrellus kuhlii]|uniref:proline-rich membrane anchor 1 isoform X3 n=1 Tax=Pipistrellus kuhlii TaxID=59472 RepID=UPI001E273786|nr:proline-rich membrane anchor 1 isoform X3 [Pipistrellus kuhlii]
METEPLRRHWRGARAGAARAAGGGRGSRLFSFFVHYLSLLPRPCARAALPAAAPAAPPAGGRGGPGEPRTPRPAQPGGAPERRAGTRGGRPVPVRVRVPGAWRTLSPPSPPPWRPARPRTPGAAPPALRAAGRSGEPPGAQRGPRRPSRAQTFAPAPALLPAREAPAPAQPPAPSSTACPAEESWWSGLVIVIAVGCASLLFLTVLVVICYKAFKRKPLRKEENGTSVAEYPMTPSQSSKAVDANNAVV